MEIWEAENIDPEQLRSYLSTRAEKDYLLVDVRQPLEYEIMHIPGAHLIPLPDLVQTLEALPRNKELIFYCRSGDRSAVAATMVIEEEMTDQRIYHLTTGILGWQGQKLTDKPQVQLVAKHHDLSEQLAAAMKLEKGAYRLYQHLLAMKAAQPLRQVFIELSRAESAHAHMVYRQWAPLQRETEPFDVLFDQLDGEILEGGRQWADIIRQIDEMTGASCIDLLELALSIEWAAYDLYRSLANSAADPTAADVFMIIAQAEKAHMQRLSRALGDC